MYHSEQLVVTKITYDHFATKESLHSLFPLMADEGIDEDTGVCDEN